VGGIQAMNGGIRNHSGRFPRIAVPVLVALLVLGGACRRGTPPPDAATPRNLILISIDTLRADRLGAYGYDRPTSPAMDALGSKGVRFEVAIAEACWTLPSHVTLMSGLPPALHGVTVPTRKVSPDVPLLAEVLRDAGFHTIGLTGGRFLSRRFGFDRGFAHFDDGGLSFARSLAEAGARIAEMDPAERFFVFIHTYDVHCPYDPPPEYAAQFETRPEADHLDTRGRCGNPHYNKMALTAGQARFLSDRYDGSIRYADDLLGNFLARLARLGVLDTTVVAIVSDHGEEFLEHGKIGHRGTLYIQALRVPWLMAGPGLPPQVVREPVGLADFMPTVLDLLGVPAPPMRGTSLMPVIRGEREARRDRMVFSQNDWGLLLYSAMVGDHHVVVDSIHWVAHFFDWRADPEEQTDLAGRDAGWIRDLWLAARSRFSALANDEARVTAEEAAPANVEEHEQLRALGYIER
jgi:arylsulfatase A-like enzyme